MMAHQGGLSILVVSYRRADLLSRCLSSVLKNLPNYRVLVYDNRSDGTLAVRQLAHRHPEVEWYFGDRNIGFGAAVNRLAVRAAPDDLLLLNPDAELTGNLFACRTMLQSPDVGAVSPTVIDPTGKTKPWDIAHRSQTAMRALVNQSGYADKLRGTPLSDLYAARPFRVDGYLAGCCLLLSRAAWDDLGGFDERFFVYGEEADWQRRAHRSGWQLLLVNEPHVRHRGHGTTADDILAARRSLDLLRGASAQLLGIHNNLGAGTVFTAGSHLLDRIQRSRRTLRREVYARSSAEARPAVLLTINEPSIGPAQRQIILLANELAGRGWPVTIACLQSFGPLLSDLDLRVRLVLTPCWQPFVDLPSRDAVLITGTTRTEAIFAFGWQNACLDRRRRRRWLLILHDTGFDGSGAVANIVIRCSNGVIAPVGRPWHGAAADIYENICADLMSR